MDPVSQTVLGGAIGALFRPKLGGKAVVLGAFCGALPDIDVVMGYAGEWQTLVHHRGATHSLLVLTLAAPVFGWVGWRWSGRTHFWRWTHLAFWALITHPLLDWCTSYGTQLLWPLTHRRFANDAVAVIDPPYTLVLLAAVLLNLVRRVSAAGARRAAAVALVLSTAYLALGYVQSRRAIALAESALADHGFAPVEVRGMPTLFNLWVRRVAARDARGNVAVGHVSTLGPKPIEFEFLEWPDDPLVDAALASERGEIFRWFAMDLLGAEVERDGDEVRVTFSDQRYGLITRPTASPFRAQAVFRDGRLVDMSRAARDVRGTDVGTELRALWRLMW